MRAVVCSEFNSPVTVEEVSLPPLGDYDVRVSLAASGICHSDLSMLKGWTGHAMPMVLGHEGAGNVIEVGKAVTRCRVGDRVIASWASACGDCWHCIRREGQHCENIPAVNDSHGVLRLDGSWVATMAGLGTFADCMQVSEFSVVPVHTDLPAEELALIGCGVTTGVGAALWTAGVTPGSTVAVFGLGGVGLSFVQGARIAGASQIIGIDPLLSKRNIALQMGASDALDPLGGDVIEEVLAKTDGRGVDYAFDVVGNPTVALQAFEVTRKRGTMVVVGMAKLEDVVPISMVKLFANEKRVIGSKYGSVQVREHFPLLVKFVESGKLQLAPMVSRRIQLSDINQALDAMESSDVVRSIIVPG